MMDEGETHARVFPFVPSDPEPDYLPVVAFIVGFLATVFAGLWIFPIGEIIMQMGKLK